METAAVQATATSAIEPSARREYVITRRIALAPFALASIIFTASSNKLRLGARLEEPEDEVTRQSRPPPRGALQSHLFFPSRRPSSAAAATVAAIAPADVPPTLRNR